MTDFHKQTTLPDLNRRAEKIALPKQIGPYKIDGVLTKGGMSILYLGIHPGTLKPIVIKALLPKYCKKKEMVSRFLKEAEIIGMSQHPNIVELFGHGEWEKGLYIAMEFVQGISLHAIIQQKSLSRKKALDVILQIARALSHLHISGIIHRDLKPENILITESGNIKVIDFGIAQVSYSTEKERITQKNRMMGTPVYMSPEQKENPASVSFASDIYSLGIIAYELLLARFSHGVIHLDLLPKRFRKIIEKCLKINPQERYTDIADFMFAISSALKNEPDEEPQDEAFELFEEMQNLLVPKTGPVWSQVEIGLAIAPSLDPLYIDFFHLPQNQYAIVLAEIEEPNPTSLMHLSLFKGMFNMAISHHLPKKIMDALNQALRHHSLKIKTCFLILDPEKNLATFISCKYTEALHIVEGSLNIRRLATPNPALGGEESPLLELTDNWNPGDRIVLHSIGAPLMEKEEWIREHLLTSGKNFKEKISKEWTGPKNALSKQKAAIITINRIF